MAILLQEQAAQCLVSDSDATGTKTGWTGRVITERNTQKYCLDPDMQQLNTFVHKQDTKELEHQGAIFWNIKSMCVL